MRTMLTAACLCLLSLTRPPAAVAQKDIGHDYPPFTEINGCYRDIYRDQRFGAANFDVDDTGKQTRVEGHSIFIVYNCTSNVSMLEMARTVIEQAKSINAQILHQNATDEQAHYLSARFERNGRTVWVQVSCCEFEYQFIEEMPFEPKTNPSPR